jgi:hypothetical protein
MDAKLLRAQRSVMTISSPVLEERALPAARER